MFQWGIIKLTKMRIKPKTRLGKTSLSLIIIFIVVILISIILVNVLGILSYDDTWWDITVNVFILPIVALVLGVIALTKKGDDCLLVNISIWISIFAILFIILHSLFIND